MDGRKIICKICHSICIFRGNLVYIKRHECLDCRNYEYRPITNNEWILLDLNKRNLHYRFNDTEQSIMLYDNMNNILKKEPCQELTHELAISLLNKLKTFETFE